MEHTPYHDIDILPDHIEMKRSASSCNRWWNYSLTCKTCRTSAALPDGNKVDFKGADFILKHGHGTHTFDVVPVRVALVVALEPGTNPKEVVEEIQQIVDRNKPEGVLCVRPI